MNDYILEIVEDDNQNLSVELPEDLLMELGEVGDLLSWHLRGDGIRQSYLTLEYDEIGNILRGDGISRPVTKRDRRYHRP